jgi:hypothetical protein
VANNGAGGPVSPELLVRLGVRPKPAPGGQTAGQAVVPAVDGREAAFRNTSSQCLEMIAGCFERMENEGAATPPVQATYLRGLKTLSAAAQYRNCPELEEPLALQLRILEGR